MDKKISFGVKGFDVIDDYSDDQFAIAEIYVCHDGNNLHNMPIDLSVIKKAARTLKNKFLVAGFDGGDFEGHEPDEQIVGFFPEGSEMKYVEKDGKTYLVAQAIISKVYAKWAYDVFVEDEDNERAVSMEITVLGSEIDDDGLEHITKFVFNGVTLLGETHMPACEGSNASIIKFSKENALKVYSKRLRNSEKIKKNFVKDMKLAEISRKEESEEMENKEQEIVETVEEEVVVETPVEEIKEAEEVEVATKAEETEEFTKEASDEDTYMEEDESEKKDEADEDKESDEDDKEDESEDDKEEDMECNKTFESLTVEQKYEVFRSAVKESLDGCGYLESYDDEYLYVYDYCDGNTVRYAYTLDGTTCTIDVDSKTRVMRGGYVEFEVYEENNNKLETLEKENCELKEKLMAYETAEKEKSVEAILSEVVDVIPADRIAELREKAAEFSLDNLSVFENEVKAIAFEAVAKEVKGNKYSFTKMPINNYIEKKTSKYGW